MSELDQLSTIKELEWRGRKAAEKEKDLILLV